MPLHVLTPFPDCSNDRHQGLVERPEISHDTHVVKSSYTTPTASTAQIPAVAHRLCARVLFACCCEPVSGPGGVK